VYIYKRPFDSYCNSYCLVLTLSDDDDTAGADVGVTGNWRRCGHNWCGRGHVTIDGVGVTGAAFGETGVGVGVSRLCRQNGWCRRRMVWGGVGRGPLTLLAYPECHKISLAVSPGCKVLLTKRWESSQLKRPIQTW
jgi:hypothetical protein